METIPSAKASRFRQLRPYYKIDNFPVRRRNLIILLSVLGLVGLLTSFGVYSKTQFSCLECRATLERGWIVGIPFQSIVPNFYSQSILSHDPAHQHRWRWCGSTQSYTWISTVYSCGRSHPIWQLPISIQEDYAHLVPANELENTLKAIDSRDREIAEATVKHVYTTVFNSP
jgi:hypothetical protein